MASLGGSFVSNDIEDYYLTPFDLGYGSFVKFDHEFVGRKALEKLAKKPQRQKVTLAWNGEDVPKRSARCSRAGSGVSKYIDFPLANYATLPFDKVLKGSKDVGAVDLHRAQLQRAFDALPRGRRREARETGHKAHARVGRGRRRHSKPTVERHKQAKIRATVGPAAVRRYGAYGVSAEVTASRPPRLCIECARGDGLVGQGLGLQWARLRRQMPHGGAW